MIALKDVFRKNHPITIYENSIIDATVIFVFTSIALLIIFIYILIENGIKEAISVFTTINGISIGIIIWTLIIANMFFSGIRFIHRHNKAIKNGEHYEGIVKERKYQFVGTKSSTRYRFIIEIDCGKIIKTPTFIDVPEPFRYCSVYHYKNRYYFSDFRW